MYRAGSFDEYMSEQFRDPEFARGFIMDLVNDEEEPIEIEDALRIIIRTMGVTEFAQMIGENKSNVGSFLNGSRKLKEETLNKYLKPFGVRIKKILEEVA